MNCEQRVRFVTGANSRYFFMCGILLESLNEFFPEILSFVMDFGLTESEAQFFETKKKLVRATCFQTLVFLKWAELKLQVYHAKCADFKMSRFQTTYDGNQSQ